MVFSLHVQTNGSWRKHSFPALPLHSKLWVWNSETTSIDTSSVDCPEGGPLPFWATCHHRRLFCPLGSQSRLWSQLSAVLSLLLLEEISIRGGLATIVRFIHHLEAVIFKPCLVCALWISLYVGQRWGGISWQVVQLETPCFCSLSQSNFFIL